MRNVIDTVRATIDRDVIKHVVGHVDHGTESSHGNENSNIFAATVPVLHTIRTAFGSFFLYSYGK